MSKHKTPKAQNAKTQVNSSALGTSLRHQTRSSQRGLGRFSPTPSAAHSACLFEAPDHDNNSWSRHSLESRHAQYIRFFRTGILFRFANFTAENTIGSESEA